jgi:hypothetical protein
MNYCGTESLLQENGIMTIDFLFLDHHRFFSAVCIHGSRDESECVKT